MNRRKSKLSPEQIALERIRDTARQGKTELDLRGLGIERLPTEIGQLTHITSLGLGNNKLQELPKEIGQLLALKRLSMENNLLVELPEEIGQIKELEFLNGFRNNLLTLPLSISNLTKLKSLALSHNQIRILPEGVGELKQLRSIYLRENKLASIPKSIGGLTNLRDLRLSGNQLRTLPKELGQLKHLTTLRLSNNQLTSIPTELVALRQLKQLYLHDNEGLGLGPSVLGPTWEDVMRKKSRPAEPRIILDYYLRARKSGRPLNEVKLILVGRGQTGKTSLVRRLIWNKFNPKEKETPGICITPWEHCCGKTNVRLHVWDFAGQEMTHATHQFFFTDRSIYVLVLTGREDSQERDADYWMRLIKSFAGDSPVIVVLNKVRLHPFSVDENALRERHPSIKAFIRTDCKSNTGIALLKKEVESIVNEMESVRTPFPSEWFAIKDSLAQMKESYLPYTSYQRLCESNGELDTQSQARLAGHLHALGVALNYGDDPRLKHTTVLNPRWVTNGIYVILRAKLKDRQPGELNLEDMSRILPKEKKEMREYLVELMRRFELCFPLGETNGRYLVPQRLDPHQPSLEKAWQEDREALRIRYEYTALPEGLIPRFIVRTYSLSEGQPRWRHGVVLAFEGASALVRGDTLRADKVDIVVRGEAGPAQRLAAIIRENFGRIHADLKELKPVEKVEVKEQAGLFLEVAALANTEIDSQRAAIPTATGDVQVNKTRELNRLTPEKARRARPSPVRVFVSYAHLDETWKDAFGMHLDILRNERLIQDWHDRRIVPGQDWDREIRRELQEADLIIFLVSTPFLASGYIQGVEVRQAMTREKTGGAIVVPVILKDCAWKEQKWKKNHALPKDGKPVNHWGRRDEAWHNVEQGIRRTITAIRKKLALSDTDFGSE